MQRSCAAASPLVKFPTCVLTFHAQGMKVAVIEGAEIGGTCVNRGCVPSKALLAASGRVRDFRECFGLSSPFVHAGIRWGVNVMEFNCHIMLIQY